MKTLLSTKILGPKARNRIEGAGITLVEYDAISVRYKNVGPIPHADYLIFSSQNAVRAFLQGTPGDAPVRNCPCLCVGPKTRALLESSGMEVLKSTKNAETLAEYLITHHRYASLLFFCGDRRREELPRKLRQHQLSLTERVVYETTANPQQVNGDFEAVLFFSPSAVESFFLSNSLQQATAICIGPTTAASLQDRCTNILIASQPTQEAVAELALTHCLPESRGSNPKEHSAC